jgi:hypothetical protein
MNNQLSPYLIFLPTNTKQRVLQALFGSRIPIDVLVFSNNQGLSNKIYQKDLIKTLEYSNKTIIEHLKNMTDLGILTDGREKMRSGKRTVWVKYFYLTDLGRWFALLILKEKSLSVHEKIGIIRKAFRLYVTWIKEFSEEIGVEQKAIHEILLRDMEK